jgi:Flp pilus assembly protein TadD
VRVWEAGGGRELWNADGVSGFVFSPDGRRLATVGPSGVRLWEADGGRELWKADGASGSVSFSPDGRRLAVGSSKAALVLETDGGRVVWKLDGDFTRVTFSPDGRWLVCSSTSDLRVFGGSSDLATVQEIRRRGAEAYRTTWHERRATEGETAGDWPAAEFHRRWLTRIQPESGLAHYQYGVTLAHLGNHDSAKREFVSALELKTSLKPLITADCHALLGQWKEAYEVYSVEATARFAVPQTSGRTAELALASEGPASYRSACEKMLKRFRSTNQVATAMDTAWACAIGPDALPDMAPAVGLARQGTPNDANARRTLGAVLYRAGKHDEAVTELTAAIKLSTQGGTWADHVFLAMAQHKLGKTDDALKSLATTEKLLDSDPVWWWSDKLERQLLRDEATKLIRGK